MQQVMGQEEPTHLPEEKAPNLTWMQGQSSSRKEGWAHSPSEWGLDSVTYFQATQQKHKYHKDIWEAQLSPKDRGCYHWLLVLVDFVEIWCVLFLGF